MALLAAQIDSGASIITPFLAGLYGPDIANYRREIQRALSLGYTIQRHGFEQLGYQGFLPMLVRKDQQ